MKTGSAKKPRAAIVLSGCGVYDGTEIHEAVIALLCLLKGGAEVSFFAPDMGQSDCVNHLDGSDSGAPRSVLAESARIARGKIEPLSRFNPEHFDMLVFPGGFGAAKNLSTFAYDGRGARWSRLSKGRFPECARSAGKSRFCAYRP